MTARGQAHEATFSHDADTGARQPLPAMPAVPGLFAAGAMRHRPQHAANGCLQITGAQVASGAQRC